MCTVYFTHNIVISMSIATCTCSHHSNNTSTTIQYLQGVEGGWGNRGCRGFSVNTSLLHEVIDY